jgi:tRNA A-37 threonylcarbamoyl transferase component Bud32
LDSRLSLPKNTVLGESYRIERVIGSGGFGITYAAEDIHLGTRVAIKEYYPDEFGSRDDTLRVRPKSHRQKETFDWGLRSFLEEARTLARFRHPSVVQVTRVFEAHSTAYMVMTFEEGKDFEAWLRALGRAPTQAELDRIAGPLLDALEMMHAQKFLHRDIAPDNIIVRADGTPVLLDFGAARRAVAEKSRTLTGIVKTGYSPFEQYATDGRLQGPWTDLYALGATLYRAVTGKPPEEATLRVADDRVAPATTVALANYRTGFLAAIDACLRVKHVERPQSVAQLRPMLLSQEAPAETRRLVVETRKIDPAQTAPPAVTVQRAPGLWPIAVAGILVLVGGAYGGIEYARRAADNQGRQPAEARRQADAAATRKRVDESGEARVDRPAATEVATQPAPPVVSSPAPAAKQDPPSPSPAIDNALRAPLWAANAAEVSAWRLKSTTRLSGALSNTAVSFDRTMVAVTGAREGSLQVIDALTLRPRAKIMMANYTSYSLGGIAIFADNKRLAVVRSGGLEVYDIAGKSQIQAIPAFEGYDKGDLALSKDAQRLYWIRSSISRQRSTVGVYAIAPESLVHEIDMNFDVRIDSFDVTADGGQFLLGMYPSNQLALYDARDRRFIWAQTCDCSGKFGAGDHVVAFAGRPGASAGDYGKTSMIGILNVAEPDRPTTFDTKTTETLYITDVSPDGLMAAVGSTNIGQVMIVPILVEEHAKLRPLTILKDNSGQSISGATFVGRDSLVTTSGDNNARLWKK